MIMLGAGSVVRTCCYEPKGSEKRVPLWFCLAGGLFVFFGFGV